MTWEIIHNQGVKALLKIIKHTGQRTTTSWYLYSRIKLSSAQQCWLKFWRATFTVDTLYSIQKHFFLNLYRIILICVMVGYFFACLLLRLTSMFVHIYIYTVQTILFTYFANFYEIFQYIIVKDLVILVSYN